MSRQSTTNSSKANSHHADIAGNAQKNSHDELVEMAAEQFASLLLKHCQCSRRIQEIGKVTQGGKGKKEYVISVMRQGLRCSHSGRQNKESPVRRFLE